MQVFRGSSAGLVHSRWLQISWDDYAGAVGATRPAVGNVDADADAEIVVGLDRYGTEGGWFTVHDDRRHGFAPVEWQQLEWTRFTATGEGVSPVVIHRP
jgi:hypothetical protein